MDALISEVLVCGGTAGLVSNSICHPIDTIKAMIQFGTGSNRITWRDIKHAWKKEGVRPFYRGYPTVLVSTVPCTATYFLSYEQSKKIIPGSDESVLKQSLCGVCSQLLSSLLFTPRDVIKERLQVQHLQTGSMKNKYRGSWDALTQIYKTDGFYGLYRGYFQTLSLWSVYGAIYLGVYTKTKYWTKKQTNKENLDPLFILLCAVVSAAFAAAITNPLDVVKLHYQVHSQKQSFWSILSDTTKKYGYEVWLRGTGARVGWIAPRTALSFTTYEICKSYFSKDRVQK